MDDTIYVIIKVLFDFVLVAWFSKVLPCHIIAYLTYSKTCNKRSLKNRQDKDLNDKWHLNEGQKYSKMLPLEHSEILLTCIKR